MSMEKAEIPQEFCVTFSHSANGVRCIWTPENSGELIRANWSWNKVGSALATWMPIAQAVSAEDMNSMLSYTQKRMKDEGYVPYYMYRQKNSSGNLENVGYAKHGTMSTYNVNIMEEKQTIIALGGGGSSKVILGDRIERVFNFKDPLEYITRFDEILDKKDEIFDLINNK